VVATPEAIVRAKRHDVSLAALLLRHQFGDWGDLDAHDRNANEAALVDGSRIMSVYGEGDRKLYVITDAETDVCPACGFGRGTCEPDKGEWQSGMHFRTDLPAWRHTTTVLRPEDY
jgi:hypothetical protein